MASHRASGTSFRRPPERVHGRRRAEAPPAPRPAPPTSYLSEQAAASTFPARLGQQEAAAVVPAARRTAPAAAGELPPARTRRELREREAAAVPLSRREVRQREELARARRRAEARAGRTSHLPQVGVVGVLGLATIVAPLAGDVLPTSSHTAEASPASPVTAAAPQAVTDFRVVPTEADQDKHVPDSLATEGRVVPSAEELTALRDAGTRASREIERVAVEQARLLQAVAGCDAAHVDIGAANGRLSTDDMCELWGTGHYLRADAAVALARLSFAYKDHFGYDLKITDSYRSYSAQVNLRARKPGLAARPGTSEHGWGLAVDFGGGVERADQHYAWLRENAPAFGWDNPAWARQGGSGAYEPWHWEYVAGQTG